MNNISRKKMIIIVLTIAFVQFLAVILEFCLLKDDFLGDEIYSYATSNSDQTMNPILDDDGTLHIDEWLTPEQVYRSIVVSKDDLFSYGNINRILESDAHPPLYFYLLHFFSSFFIGEFSWIPAIIINSLSILVGQIFFYRLFLLISKSRFHSLLGMIFFGFSSAVINMMTFARNYTLMTALTLIYTFYIFRSVYQRSMGENTTKSVVLAAVFLYLASLTQYLSVVFGFCITLLICIRYLIKKDFKVMLKTGLFMTGGIALMILSFHYVLHQLTSDQTAMDNATAFPFSFEIRIAIHILFNELFGINTNVYPSMATFWIFWGIVGIAILCLICGFLFRTDEWFKSILVRLKEMGKSIIKRLNSPQSFLYFLLLITTIILVMIISYQFKMYFYYPYSDRYLFILYPYVAMIVLIPIFKIIRIKYLNIVAIICLITLSLIIGKKPYFGFSEMSIKNVSETLAGSDVVIFVPNHHTAIKSTLYLKDCDKIFYTTEEYFYDNIEYFIQGLSKDKPLYMLYYWPTYNNADTNSKLLILLKDLENASITTLNDNRKNYGAKPIAGINGHALFRLR